MTTELVRVTDDNPLKTLQREDGTWSARDVQASGHVHTRWEHWEDAIQRGMNLLKTFGLDVSAGQDHFHSTVKVHTNPTGGTYEMQDYSLTPLGLFAACQQARLPELDLWFVFAGMQAAGYGDVSTQVSQPVSADPEDKGEDKKLSRRPKLYNDRGLPTAAGLDFLIGRGVHVIPTANGPMYVDLESVPADPAPRFGTPGPR